MLEEELRGSKEGVAGARRRRGHAREVLEPRHLGNHLLVATFVHLLLEEEETVVVHRHRLAAGDSAGLGISAAQILHRLFDTEDPRCNGTGIVSLCFEDVRVRCVRETA